jgi:aryl-alcohol dehydrogenase-like predicted oxidoreductase
MLGRTGLVVSRLGLGLAALGRPGYVNLGHAEDLGSEYDEGWMEGHAHRVLDAAWASGIRYFDVARSYGLAEKFLAEWIADRSVSPADVAVASKWGYTYTADWKADADVHEVKDHTLAALQRQWPESRAQLGPFLRVYQIHSATPESGVLEDGAVLDELARVRAQDGVHIGLTLSGPEQAATLRRAMAITRDGVPLFETVQATWNLLEPSVGPALAEAHDAGMGVVVKEAVANGRLTARNQDAGFATSLAQLEGEAASLDVSIDAVAIAACLAQPFVDVVLSGAATSDQVEANVTAEHIRLDEATCARLLGLAEPAAEYWSKRRALRWN